MNDPDEEAARRAQAVEAHARRQAEARAKASRNRVPLVDKRRPRRALAKATECCRKRTRIPIGVISKLQWPIVQELGRREGVKIDRQGYVQAPERALSGAR